MPGSDPGEINNIMICSHPGKPLERHLITTLDIALQIKENFGIELSPTVLVAICFHDLGKAHPKFQLKLCKVCPQRKECSKRFKGTESRTSNFGHAEPSAVLVFAMTRDPIAAEIVRRHHTELENLSSASKFWSEKEYIGDPSSEDAVVNVIKKIPFWTGLLNVARKIKIIHGDLGHSLEHMVCDVESNHAHWLRYLPGQEEWDDLVFDIWQDLVYDNDEKNMSLLWLKTRQAYSVLITSDRWEASTGSNFTVGRLVIDHEKISNYANSLKNTASKFGPWRESVRKSVVENARNVISEPGVYTITLPTGTGKTLIGLTVAAEAAEKFHATGIIYCLPYISIVEQNADVAARLFDRVQEDHSLAYDASPGPASSSSGRTEVTQNDGRESTPEERFMAFYRYWRSPVVVTTLAKMWEVLFSPKANDTMSFHRLSRAVVILDEPQTIPARYWDGFGKTLSLISRETGTTFILMTATQPEIVEKSSRAELARERYAFPKNRYRVEWLGQARPKMTLTDLKAFIEEEGLKDQDVAAVMNTKECALRLYCHMKSAGVEPFLLSRWVTPHDRRDVMRKLHSMEKEGKRRWLAATQVIEAGVDLDFRVVIRDLGPLDSIVQVAGRCNRHGEREDEGRVIVVDMVDDSRERIRRYSSVYDSVLLNQTKQVLSEYPVFDESEASSVISRYYRLVRGAIERSPLWDQICKGDWGEYERLIEEEQRGIPEVTLIVDKDGTVGRLAMEAFTNGKNFEDIERRDALFRSISQHSIEVRKDYLEAWLSSTGSYFIDEDRPALECINDEGTMWLLNPKGLGTIYREGIGFIPLNIASEFEDVLKQSG